MNSAHISLGVPLEAIYFDCDSTLATIEGIDALCEARSEPLPESIRALTDAAMNGEATIEEVYERRLEILRPTRAMLAMVGELYIEHEVAGARETIAALQALGKTVGIISGGLLQPVQRFAEALGVETDHVHAVPTVHDADGALIDFDRSSWLWQSGGKPNLLRSMGGVIQPCGFVGDGATDLETQSVVRRFVGFGGVVARQLVADNAEVFVTEPDLRFTLRHLLTPAEHRRLHQLAAEREQAWLPAEDPPSDTAPGSDD